MSLENRVLLMGIIESLSGLDRPFAYSSSCISLPLQQFVILSSPLCSPDSTFARSRAFANSCTDFTSYFKKQGFLAMSNPYSAPSPSQSPPPSFGGGGSSVHGPATALMIVALVAVILGTLALCMDIFLLVSGATEMLDAQNNSPVPAQTRIIFRSFWGFVLVCVSSFVLYGSIQMRAQKNYGIAKAAAIVAMIPLLGPCCILGIPFGIWAFVALNKPGVKESFN